MECRPLRVLLLTDVFPKPSNLQHGVWALVQAQGLQEAGADIRVASPNPWVPRVLGRLHVKARRLTDCPSQYDWGTLHVDYPRWPYYNIGGRAPMLRRWPSPLIACAKPFLHGYFRRLFRSWTPDVLFVHHTVPAGKVAVWIKREFGIPFVTQDHDFGSIEDCRLFTNRRRAFATVAGEVATATAVVKRMSDSMREQFPARWNVPLYMGTKAIDPSLATVPRPAECASKLVVFSAAVLYERKAMPDLVRAFAIVAKRHPNVVLRIGGDGPCMPQVMAAVAESGVADRITLLGNLTHPQIMQEMSWCDIFMLTGWDEPWGVVYLEAMSAGKPIICSNDGGICEVVQDGREGRTVPPRDVPAAAAALEQMVADRAMRERMGRDALDLFNSRLEISGIARETLDILREAAHSAASPPVPSRSQA